MCRPIKDIVADLEAKYNGIQLLYDLNDRRRVIAEFYRDVEYMFSRFKNYEDDVKFVIDHKLDVNIIKRITLNLILIMQQLCDSVLLYRHAIEFYLMDEYYKKNSQLYNDYRDYHERLTNFFARLNNIDIINLTMPNNKGVLNRLCLNDDPDEQEGTSIITQINLNIDELEKMNTLELNISLEYILNIFQNNLWVSKYITMERDKDSMELIYDLNYLLYAKTYWPSRCDNFRAHITHQRLKGKVDINGLELLKKEAIYQFEYNTTTGKIWRDYSEDVTQMAIQMKENFIKKEKNEDEEMWKFFFQNIFELEEYDRWIEELRNPPESEEMKQKRERLLKTNKVFNLKPANSKNEIDILLLYQYIESRFVNDNKFVYEWFALFYLFRRKGLLNNCTVEDFERQMNDDEWFGHVEKKCKANEINTYSFLIEKRPDDWNIKYKPAGSNKASTKAINKLYRKYSDLEDTIEEIYIQE